MSYLSQSQIDFYQRNGFLVIENYASEEEIFMLKKNALNIIKEFSLQEVKIFTTEDQNKILDTYFLESGDKVRCFFEAEAFDKNGNLVVDKTLAINKIGHAMHDLMPDFEKFSYKKELLKIMQDVGLSAPLIVQSQYIFKQPKIGAKVNPHVDSTFIYTEPLSCTGAWIALEDATIENGCLSIIPGSHRKYPLQQQYIRNSTNTGTEFVNTLHERAVWDTTQLEPLEAKKGDLVLLHGEVVHASYPNHSEKSRHAFVLHMVNNNAKWSPKNWLQRSSTLPFRLIKNVV